MAGSDWTHDLQPNISSIVEYFERKGTSLGRSGVGRGGLQLSSRIAALRRSLEKQQQGPSGSGTGGTGGGVGGGGGGSGSPHPTPQRSKCSRLVVCEGAVRSKLPLFDKK